MTEGQLTIGSDHESSIASLSSLTEASGCVFASTDPRQASKYVARLLAVSADRGLQRGQLTLSQPYLNHVQKTKYHCVCAKVVCRLFRRDGGRTPFREAVPQNAQRMAVLLVWASLAGGASGVK